jgi:ankyrin repeat protein
MENRTALHCATCENQIETVKLLLKYGASTEARTLHYRTPLHFACILGEDIICKLLLEAGSFVNVQDFERNAPIHYAAFYGDVKIIKLLLEKNADLELKNRKGQLPLDLASDKIISNLLKQHLAKLGKCYRKRNVAFQKKILTKKDSVKQLNISSAKYTSCRNLKVPIKPLLSSDTLSAEVSLV